MELLLAGMLGREGKSLGERERVQGVSVDTGLDGALQADQLT